MTSGSGPPIGRAGASHPATIRAARCVPEGAMPASRADDARRIFSGIGATYERAGALRSFGQDARRRERLASFLDARSDDAILRVATGTLLAARASAERYRCRELGLDRQ